LFLLPAPAAVVVQDLNAQPLLLEQVDASYDAVLCVNGLQYLTQPELVLTEVRCQQQQRQQQQQAGGLLCTRTAACAASALPFSVAC
jgi:hypothetical protein